MTPQSMHGQPGGWGPSPMSQSAGGYGGNHTPGGYMQQPQSAPFGRGFGGYQG